MAARAQRVAHVAREHGCEHVIVTADGFKPETPAYWEELTKRVKNVLAPSTTTQRREPRDPPRREGPPVGATREHALKVS